MTKPFFGLWIILVCILIAGLLFYFRQRTLIYAPSKTTPTQKTFQAEDLDIIKLMTADGMLLNNWYKPAHHGKPTLIIFHGNAGHIGKRMPLARALIKQGFGVFLLEYRGYGGNPGTPSEQGLYEDARAGMTYLKKRNISPQSIVLYGESIGTGVATKMAIEHPNSCALILQSPYTTLAKLGKYHYPWNPIAPWDKFDSESRMSAIHIPLLIFHGTKDTTIPYQQGKDLFNAANEPKQWVTLYDQGHNELWTADFIQTLSAFITKHCE